MRSPDVADLADPLLPARLTHVLWLGGPSDAGKTTVARLLTETYGWTWYACDPLEGEHFVTRGDPVARPYCWRAGRRSPDEAWLGSTPEAMVEDVLATNAERFPQVVADLLALPAGRPVLAEGPRLFPHLVVPLLSDPLQAAWLRPDPAFARDSRERRGKPVSADRTRDPAAARRAFARREDLLAAHYDAELAAYGHEALPVRGHEPPSLVAAGLAAGYERYLCSHEEVR